MSDSSVKSKFSERILIAMRKMTTKDWVLLLIAIVAIWFGISSAYYKNMAAERKLVFVTDSLENYKNKYNEEYIARNMYIQTIEELRKTNADLYDEVKSLQDNPLVVTKTKVDVRVDTIYAESDAIVTDTVNQTKNLYWHYTEPTGYYHIAGMTGVKQDFSDFQTKITDLSVPADLTVDVIETKDGQLKVITKSSNPYIKLTDTNGVFIDPTKSKAVKSQFKAKRWNIGPMVGYGVTSDLKFRPYIGVGITYGIIQF